MVDFILSLMSQSKQKISKNRVTLALKICIFFYIESNNTSISILKSE